MTGGWKRKLYKWTLGVLAGLIILTALAAGAFKLATNIVPRYHHDIERIASRRAGFPIRFKRVAIAWHGMGPELVLDHVQAVNPQSGQVFARSQEIRIGISLLSIIKGHLRKPDRIVLDEPKVALRWRKGTQVAVIGMPAPVAPSTKKINLAQLIRQLFAQSVIVHDAKCTVDLPKFSRHWVFTRINATLKSGSTSHVSVRMQLPSELGQTLSLTGSLAQVSQTVSSWGWHGSLQLSEIHLAAMAPFISRRVHGLQGRLSANLHFSGKGLRLTGTGGRTLFHYLQADGVRYNQLGGDWQWKKEADGWEFRIPDFALVTRQKRWPQQAIDISHRNGRWRAKIGYLRLQDLTPLVKLFPADLDPLADRLTAMQPSGVIAGARFGYTPGKYNLKLVAGIRDLSWKPADHFPGIRNFSANININQGKSAINLDEKNLILEMPHLFAGPLRFKAIKGTLRLVRAEAGWRLGTDKLDLKTPYFAGTLGGQVDFPDRGTPKVQLIGEATNIPVNAESHYIPVHKLPKKLVAWLQGGFKAGTVKEVKLRLQGPIQAFPFRHGNGDFDIRMSFDKVALRPGKQWPLLQSLAGTVHLHNASMVARIDRGQVSGATIEKGTASIPDLYHAELSVSSHLKGRAVQFLDFLHHSPASSRIGHRLDALKISGMTRVTVNLHLPTSHMNRFKLHGQLRLSDTNASWQGAPIKLRRLRGAIVFNRYGISKGTLKGVLLTQPVRFIFSQGQNHGVMHVRMEGRFPVQKLATYTKLPLQDYASGEVPLLAMLSVPMHGGSSSFLLTLYSSLLGTKIKVPAPLGKPAKKVLPVAIQLSPAGGQYAITGRVGRIASLCAVVSRVPGAVVISKVGVNLGHVECHEPASGLLVAGAVNSFNMDQWQPYFTGILSRKLSLGHAQFPIELNVKIAHFIVAGQNYPNLAVRGGTARHGFDLALVSKNLAGKMHVPNQLSNAHPLLVDIDHATVSPTHGPTESSTQKSNIGAASRSGSGGVSQKPAPSKTRTLTPNRIPPIAIHVKEIDIGKGKLTGLNIRIRRVEHGIVINPLQIDGGVLKVHGVFVWIKPPSGSTQGALQFVSNIGDLSALLNAFGVPAAISGHGAFSASLAWTGSGAKDVEKHMLGRLSMDFRDGNINKVNPGAGRILSLLNLATLPRYVVLNFHNVFGSGFPYQRIYGNFTIDQGQAHTKGLVIQSSIAWIKLIGDIHLLEETVDMNADVVPNYTGSLPVIAALVGGLGVGAAILAVTKIFGSPIAQASKMVYSINGPWSNPKVKPIKGARPKSPRVKSGQGDGG